MTIKRLYHGSPEKIEDGKIRVRPGHINGMKTEITAVFATSDLANARLYAAMRFIGTGWKFPRDSGKLFVEKLQPSISGKAYIYELDNDGFERDGPIDYYSLEDKKIKDVIEIDIMNEIKNGNIKVYILDVDTSNMTSKESLPLCEKAMKEGSFKLYNPDA